MNEQDRDGQEKVDPRVRGVQLSALGLEFAGSVLGGLVLGYYLDRWLGTAPWLMLVGTLGGMVTAVARIILLTNQFERQRKARDD